MMIRKSLFSSKQHVRGLVLGLVVSALAWFALAAWAADGLTLGVLDKGGANTTDKWQPFAQYLSKKTGQTVKIAALPFDQIEAAVQGKQIDYLLTNPGMFVDLKQKHGLKPLASMLNIRQGKSLNQFGGVIFVRADSPIKSLDQIRGKNFMVVSKSSFGGGQMALSHMIDNGINPAKDISLSQGKKHDAVVMAIKEGKADAGTVRSDTLERMAAQGKIKLNDFRVIDARKGKFPFAHSTKLYAEWPFAALAHVNDETNQKITAALTSLQAENPAAKAAKIAGWTPPLNYSEVEETVKKVQQAMTGQ